MASSTRKLIILGGLVAMFAAGCPTQTPTGTDPDTLTRSNPKRTASPKASTGPVNIDGQGSSASPSTGGSSSPSTSPSGSASNSPSPTSSSSVAPVADYWVQVNDAAGAPVNGAIVDGYAADATGVATSAGSKTSDAKGQIAKIDAAGKALNLVAVSPSDSTMMGFIASVEAAATGKNIKLEKAGNIKGSVKVEGASVNLENIKIYIAGTPFTANTNATGAFTLSNVPVGTYTVTAESAAYGKANKGAVAVAAGADTTLVADDLKLSVTAPTLTSLSATNGGTGVEITLTGTNFGATGNKAFKVTFAGAEAVTKTRVSDTSIKATVPDNGDTGDVIVTVADLPSNGKAFKVLSHMVYTNPRTTMFLGTNHTFKAAAVDKKPDASGNPSFVDTPNITGWSVEGGNAISVDQTGKVTAANVGTATLKVSSGAAFETVDVTVTNETVTVSSLAGGSQGTTDGTGAAAKFAGPIGITWNPLGGLMVADQFFNTDADQGMVLDYSAIRGVTLAGEVTKAYGAGPTGVGVDGAAGVAKFRFPSGLVYDSNGNLFVCDQGANRIRKITPTGDVSVFVGSGTATSTDGTGTGATTAGPAYICRDASDNLYFTEWGPTSEENPAGIAGRVRKVTPAGVVTTLAGGENGFFDGTGAAGRFMLPSGIAIDTAGQNLYVADFGNNAIRKIALSNNAVTTIAGPPAANEAGLSGAQGFVDSPNKDSVRFNAPAGIAFGPDGLLYVADDSNHAIRRVNVTTGATTTLVGSGSEGNADGNAATASFKNPHDLVFKPGENELYVLDNRNFKVRKIVF